MNGYFRSLRRKLGVVTLVMACVFAVEWVRSRTHLDSLTICAPKPMGIELISCPAGLGCIAYHEFLHDSIFRFAADPWMIPPDQDLLEGTGIVFKTHLGCFRSGNNLAQLPNGKTGLSAWVIPHWSVVMPLALLSAWLLLGRRRVKLPVSKMDEPV